MEASKFKLLAKFLFLLTLQKLEGRHHELLLMKARMEARRFKRAFTWKLGIQTISKV